MAQLDLPGIESAVERHLAQACPAEQALARSTLRRLPPDRWALEWHLAWWLAQAFGLDDRVAADLTMGSVLGLVAIRLEDDLLDGDLEPQDRAAAARLSPAVLREALAIFGRHVSSGSPFWTEVDRALQQWRAASAPPVGSGAGRSLPGAGPGEPRGLAARGAPLRVPALAACLLAGRADAWPVVERCLEHALAGLVLYDQVFDWQADLAAGRWNAFVAAHAVHPQLREWRDRNRVSVLVALLARGAAAEAYARIRSEMEAAALLASDLACEPLVAWSRSYAGRTAVQGDEMERHYGRAADRAVELVFGRQTAGI